MFFICLIVRACSDWIFSVYHGFHTKRLIVQGQNYIYHCNFINIITTVLGNNDAISGGAILFSRPEDSAILEGSTFINCSTWSFDWEKMSEGGGAFIEAKTITCTGLCGTHCQSKQGFFLTIKVLKGGSGNLTDLSALECNSDVRGGWSVIYLNVQSSIEMSNVNYTSCYATHGAIAVKWVGFINIPLLPMLFLRCVNLRGPCSIEMLNAHGRIISSNFANSTYLDGCFEVEQNSTLGIWNSYFLSNDTPYYFLINDINSKIMSIENCCFDVDPFTYSFKIINPPINNQVGRPNITTPRIIIPRPMVTCQPIQSIFKHQKQTPLLTNDVILADQTQLEQTERDNLTSRFTAPQKPENSSLSKGTIVGICIGILVFLVIISLILSRVYSSKPFIVSGSDSFDGEMTYEAGASAEDIGRLFASAAINVYENVGGDEQEVSSSYDQSNVRDDFEEQEILLGDDPDVND